MNYSIQRVALVLALFFTASFTALAQSMKGEIASVDAAANSLIVSAKNGSAPRTYLLKLTTEITLNGARAKLSDLTQGMAVQVTSADTGFANRIVATGAVAAAGGGGDLKTKLIGTKWVWFENDKMYEEIEFAEGGMAWWSRRNDGDFKWEVAPDGKRVEGIHVKSGNKFKMTFDATLGKGRIFQGNGPARDTHVVVRRKPEKLTPLEQALIGTTWVWFENENKQETITFTSAAKAKHSKEGVGDFLWEPTPDGKGITGVDLQTRYRFSAKFDATFTTGKITTVSGTQETHKIK